MRKSFQTIGRRPKADAPAPRLDEFPTGYSLTGCSPALPASALPAGVDITSEPCQVRGCFSTVKAVEVDRLTLNMKAANSCATKSGQLRVLPTRRLIELLSDRSQSEGTSRL